MTEKYPPLNPKFPHMIHGGDYNPDQWPEDVWAEDMRLMKLAHCNTMSVGIFAWARLEPAEGQFDFGWLDKVMDMLAENDAYAVLATPSGARPNWLAANYPEVLRVRPDRGRNLFGRRHNHCMNFNSEPVTVALPTGSFTDLLTGQDHQGDLTLDPYGVLVLQPQ